MVDATPTQSQLDVPDTSLELEYLGSITTKIVGCQYYPGAVNRNEMVIFVREPDNIYDRYAIRVDNVENIKVGHVPRTVVQYLSPLVDSGKFLLEASVPYGQQNKFSMPLDVDIYGEEADRAVLMQACVRAGCSLQNYRRVGVQFSPLPSPSAGASTSRAARSPAAAPRVPAAPKAQRLTAKQVAERVNTVFDSLMNDEEARQQLEPNEIIATKLYPHQKEALAWMVQQENSNTLPVFWQWETQGAGGTGGERYFHTLTNFTSTTRPNPTRGGILADDMGLGKTLVTISLIATNRPGVTAAALCPSSSGEDAGNADAKPSAAAVVEEEVEEEVDEEVERPTKKSRTSKKEQKKKTEKKKQPMKAAQLKNSAQPQLPANMTRPAADGPKSTLILCPLSVLPGWSMQLEQHVAAGSLSVLVYHGPQRDPRIAQISKYDIVLSTYGTLVSEKGNKNGLNAVKWLRVVADEAHIIKNPSTSTSQLVRNLSAERRWGLTGTTIQNSLRDLHGLVSFLKVDPLGDATLFRRAVERPVVNGEQGAVKKLQALVGSLALRRTKNTQRNGVPLVSLPSKEVYIVPVELDATGRAKYDRWQSAGREIVARHLSAGTLMTNYTAVLEIILRLRQICCDSSLVVSDEPNFASLTAAAPSGVSRLTQEVTQHLVQLLREGLDSECPVCLCDISQPCITICRHVFCKRCIDTVISKDKPSCPLCRAPISHIDLVELPPEPEPVEDGEETDEESGTAAQNMVHGAKVAAFLGTLNAALARDSTEKHVVFSQFTGFLDVVGNALRHSGISFCRLDGKTPAAKRNTMLCAFADESDVTGPRVFLVSLKAGGVGLNLTAANHAHLLDPYWNPAVEEQAADRVHRLGQTREVSIHRYVVKNSIEERMLLMQEEKRKLMKAAFERKLAEDVRAARLQDVRLLMQLQ
jgi:SWI/SNF-related matrix-associated actin-dependent regulator of chromatin subfamily A3